MGFKETLGKMIGIEEDRDETITAEEIEREFGVMPLTVIPEGKIEGMNDSTEKSKKRRKSRYFGRNKKRKRS